MTWFKITLLPSVKSPWGLQRRSSFLWGKRHDSHVCPDVERKVSPNRIRNVFVKREQRKLAMPSGENEDEVNVFIKSKDQRGLVHFGLARKHLYLYEHKTDGDT